MSLIRHFRRRPQPRTGDRFMPVALLGSTVLMPRPRGCEPLVGDPHVRFPSGRLT